MRKVSKKRKVNPNAKLGIARQYYRDNFSVLSGRNDLRKGHVLKLFWDDAETSASKTFRILKDTFSDDFSKSITEKIKYRIHKTVDTARKYKKLNDESEFRKFVELCNENFIENDNTVSKVSVRPTETFENYAVESAVKSDEPLENICVESVDPCFSRTPVHRVQKSLLKTRQARKCKLCVNLRQSLHDMHAKYLLNKRKVLANKKGKKRKPIIRILNQKLKRKEKKLQELKQALNSTELGMKLQNTYEKLKKVTKGKSKLKERYKKKILDISKEQDEKMFNKIVDLELTLRQKEDYIRELEHKKLKLEEEVATVKLAKVRITKDGKSYSSSVRLFTFDCIVNQVPTCHIPVLMEQFAKRNDQPLEEVPHRSTIEMMARELGIISELQTAETVINTADVTLGFDATTKGGHHVNTIHFTTRTDCLDAALDELVGGTKYDYANHICETVDSMARTYSHFNSDISFEDARKKIISNITNSMTDRCASNHAAMEIVQETWHKHINELNCHLHPLDSVATKVRAAMKNVETSKGSLSGSDCVAANVIIQLNKLRYKDSKGDPKGFTLFLSKEGLGKGLLPRYRGNRLHVMFHIGGVLSHHHDKFIKLLKTGVSCGGLRALILKDLTSDVGKVGLQVIGLLGKLLTGPWMCKFYTSSETEVNHVEGIAIVHHVVQAMKNKVDSPHDLLQPTEDFFGQPLPINDPILSSLCKTPANDTLFISFMSAAIKATIDVLERQYKRYFTLDITQVLVEETKSVRSHNMDAEEIMGMFSAAQERAPNATLCYLSSKIRAQKNRTVEYLDNLPHGKRDSILRKAVNLGRKMRSKRRNKQKDLVEEMATRQAAKEAARNTAERKALEKKLRENVEETLGKEFPELSDEKREWVTEILEKHVIGRKIRHVWFEDGTLVAYNGKIEKFKQNSKGKFFRIAYWTDSQEYADATDYDISIYAVIADLLDDDLIISQ